MDNDEARQAAYADANLASAAQAGVAAAGGAKVFDLKNSKGVEPKVRGKQVGLELSLDLNGMQVSPEK
ncbi:MAG: hypothetical protein WCB48_13555 [Casimicrobiaceae bacterium]